MASLTAAQLPEALVTKFIKEVADDLYGQTWFLNYFQKGTEEFAGNQVQFRTKVRRNPSGGFRSGTRLARPGKFAMKWATVGLKRATFSTSIDRVFMKQVRQSKPEAVVDALQMDIADLKIAGQRKLELAFMGTGDAVIAQLNGAHGAGATTFTVEDPEGRTHGAARFIEEGAYLVLQPDVPGGEVHVVADTVSWVNQTFTIDSTATGGAVPALPDQAKIVYGDPDGNSYNNEPDGGVAALFSSAANYLGLSRNTYNAWAPTSVGAVGDDTPFNVPYIQQILDIPKDVSGAGDAAGPDLLVGHSSIWRSYLAEEVLPKKLNVQVDGIYKEGIQRAAWINGDRILPIEQAATAPYGDIIGLKSEGWRIYSLGSSGLEVIPNVSGGNLHEIPGYDEYFIYMAFEGNIACRLPKQQVRIRGIRINASNLPR